MATTTGRVERKLYAWAGESARMLLAEVRFKPKRVGESVEPLMVSLSGGAHSLFESSISQKLNGARH